MQSHLKILGYTRTYVHMNMQGIKRSFSKKIRYRSKNIRRKFKMGGPST